MLNMFSAEVASIHFKERLAILPAFGERDEQLDEFKWVACLVLSRGHLRGTF